MSTCNAQAPVTRRAGEDLENELRFTLTNAETLEPYLGAWAHFAVVGAGFSSFIHAHPIGNIRRARWSTPHGSVAGPPPTELHTPW